MNVAQMVSGVVLFVLALAIVLINGVAKEAVQTANTTEEKLENVTKDGGVIDQKVKDSEDKQRKEREEALEKLQKERDEALEKIRESCRRANAQSTSGFVAQRPVATVPTPATPAPVPAQAPASSSSLAPVLPTLANSPEPEVSAKTLLQELMSSDISPRGVALTAAARLACDERNVPEIVKEYAKAHDAGDSETMKRTRFVLVSLMAEPFRKWRAGVIKNPQSVGASMEVVAANIAGELPTEPSSTPPAKVSPAKVTASNPPVLGVYLHHHDGEVKMGGNIILAGNITTTGNVKVTGQVNGRLSGTFRHEGKDVPVCWDSSSNRWVQLRN